MKQKQKKKFSKFAIVGFILSFFGFLSILGIIFCIISLVQVKKEKLRGRGLAIAGIIIGSLVLLTSTAGLFEDCELRTEIYKYSTSCHNACDSYCRDEGFEHSDGFTLDDNYDYEYENRHCECWCEGCR